MIYDGKIYLYDADYLQEEKKSSISKIRCGYILHQDSLNQKEKPNQPNQNRPIARGGFTIKVLTLHSVVASRGLNVCGCVWP